MNKNRRILTTIVFFAIGFYSCSDWLEIESEKMDKNDYTATSFSESYYAALRTYKKSDRSISFGWFSGWGDPSASTANMLSGLPDSLDLVSIWDNAFNLSEGKAADMHFVQEKKGTKVLICTFIQYVGKGFTPPEHDTDEKTREAFWGWIDKDEEAIKKSMEKYAMAIRDSIDKYGYDGLDIDFEPRIDGVRGKLDENSTYVTWFLDILSQYLGPKSNSGKMLVIDGELYYVPVSTIGYFNYLIAQAYSVSGGTPSPLAGQSEKQMDYRLMQVVKTFKSVLTEKEITNKFIITENLESAIDALNGGFFWTLRNGTRLDKAECPSLLGMAKWEPFNGFRKGGFGGYRFDAEAVNKPSYKWLRRAIQAQNPVVN